MKLMYKFVRLLMNVMLQAKEIIEANKDKLVIIADALLEYETLAGEQIEALFNTGRMLESS